MSVAHAPLEDIIEVFFSKGKILKFKKDQIVSPKNNPPDGVFYIKSGFVKLGNDPSSGEENQTYAIYKVGEVFPLLWALKDIKREFEYVAMSNVEIYQVSKQEFKDFVKSNPKAALQVIDLLTNLANIYFERIDNLVISRAHPKIVSRLLFFSKRFGDKKRGQITIQIPMTHASIASSLAITRETVSRELKKLEEKGLIVYNGRRIVINDERKLASELESYYSTISSKKRLSNLDKMIMGVYLSLAFLPAENLISF